MEKIINENYRRDELLDNGEKKWLPGDEKYNGCLRLPNSFKDLILNGAFSSAAYYLNLEIFSDWAKANDGMDMLEKLYDTFGEERAIDKETLNKLNKDKSYNDILRACLKYLDAIIKSDIDEAEKQKQTGMILDLLKLLIKFEKNIPDNMRGESSVEGRTTSSTIGELACFIANVGEESEKSAEIMSTADLKKILDTIGLFIKVAANCKVETLHIVRKLFYPTDECGRLNKSKDRETYLHIIEDTIKRSKDGEKDESVTIMAEIIIEIDRTYGFEKLIITRPNWKQEPLLAGVEQVKAALEKLTTKGYKCLLCLPYISRMFSESSWTEYWPEGRSEVEIIEALLNSDDEEFLVKTAEFLKKLHDTCGIAWTTYFYPEFMPVIYFIKKALEDENIKKLVCQELYAKKIDEDSQYNENLENLLTSMNYLAEIIKAKSDIWPDMIEIINAQPPFPSETVYNVLDIMRAEDRVLKPSEWHRQNISGGYKINSYPCEVTQGEALFFGTCRSGKEAELVTFWPIPGNTFKPVTKILVKSKEVITKLPEEQFLAFCMDYKKAQGYEFDPDSEEYVTLPAYIKTRETVCRRHLLHK